MAYPNVYGHGVLNGRGSKGGLPKYLESTTIRLRLPFGPQPGIDIALAEAEGEAVEGTSMSERVVVQLRSSDRIEDFLPYIEQIAQPGMKVMFLVHYHRTGCKAFLEQLPAIYPGIMPTLFLGRCSKGSEILHSVEKRIANSCGGLRSRGLEISVHVHTRPLRKIVRHCLQREDVHLVIMRARLYDRVIQYLRTVCPVSRFFKPSFPPVLLLHPQKL